MRIIHWRAIMTLTSINHTHTLNHGVTVALEVTAVVGEPKRTRFINQAKVLRLKGDKR